MRRILGAIVVAMVVVPMFTAGADARTRAGSDADDAVIELLGYVPSDVRGSCVVVDPAGNPPPYAAEAAFIRADLACESGNAEVTLTAYTSFSDLAAMNRVYDQYADDGAGQELISEAADCPETDEWGFGDETAGRVTCARNAVQGQPDVVRLWTDEDALILGFARAAEADAVALETWWTEEAGPLDDPEEVTGLADKSPEAIRAAERRLRKQIPADQRRDCGPIDVSDPASGYAILHAGQLFVQAAFSCNFAEGVDALTYWSVDREHVDAFFLRYKGFTAAPDGEDCPGDGTWSVGGRDVGEYACFAAVEQRPNTESKDDVLVPVDVVQINWMHRAKGFFGGAVSDGTDFDALFRFWKQDGGPVV